MSATKLHLREFFQEFGTAKKTLNVATSFYSFCNEILQLTVIFYTVIAYFKQRRSDPDVSKQQIEISIGF